jgi:hypothetical protein
MSWYGQALEAWYRSKMQSADAMSQGIQSLGQSIGKAIQGVHQNQIANQYASQLKGTPPTPPTPPHAELASPGTNPSTGEQNSVGQAVETGYKPGTPGTPGTPGIQTVPGGGVQGLQLAMAIQQLKNQQGNLQSERDLRGAQTGYYKGHTDYLKGQTDVNKKRADAYAASVAGRGQPKTPADMMKGLGLPPAVMKALSTHGGARGSIVDGKWQGDPNGPMWTPSDQAQNYDHPLSAQDVQPVMPYSDIELIKQKLGAVSSPGQTAGPNAGAPGTTAPVQVASKEEYDQLPSGTRYTDPNGAIGTKP